MAEGRVGAGISRGESGSKGEITGRRLTLKQPALRNSLTMVRTASSHETYTHNPNTSRQALSTTGDRCNIDSAGTDVQTISVLNAIFLLMPLKFISLP